jgi:hypothetical protein
MAMLSFFAEFWWVEVVFNRFSMLREDNRVLPDPEERSPVAVEHRGHSQSAGDWFKREIQDWTEFSRLPIFASESANLSTCIGLRLRFSGYCDYLPNDVVV